MSKITNDDLTRSASSCTNMARASRVNRAINIVHLSDRTTMSGTTGDVTAETSTMKSESSVTTSTSPVSTALSHSSEITDGLSQGWHLFILITLIARLLILLLAQSSLYILTPVRLSVCPSHGWIGPKRLKLGLCNFYRQ